MHLGVHLVMLVRVGPEQACISLLADKQVWKVDLHEQAGQTPSAPGSNTLCSTLIKTQMVKCVRQARIGSMQG